jgi:hypothetical protein
MDAFRVLIFSLFLLLYAFINEKYVDGTNLSRESESEFYESYQISFVDKLKKLGRLNSES